MKRLLSWLLALVMIISCLPMSVLPAFAAETPDVDDGSDTTPPDFELGMDTLLGKLSVGDNALTLAAMDQDGDTWSFTPSVDGLVTFNVTALAYDWMGEGEYTEAPANEISMGWPRMYAMVINGVQYNDSTVEVEGVAGQKIDVQIYGYMAYATKLTLTVAEGGEVIPDEPAEPGTQGNPYVIEALPYEITAEGEHDVYYSYTNNTAEEQVLTITKPEGNYVSFTDADWTSNEDGTYTVTVPAEATIIINPWGSNAGTYTVKFYEEVVYPPVEFGTKQAPSMNLLDIVYFQIEADFVDASLYDWSDEAFLSNFRWLVWKTDEDSPATKDDATIDNAPDVVECGAVYDSSIKRIRVQTPLIAKEMNDSLTWVVAYEDPATGEYTYGQFYPGYKPAEKYLGGTLYNKGGKSKDLAVALLNYGTRAQIYFDYKEDQLMNAVLPEAEQTFTWDGSLVTGSYNVDSAKEGSLVRDRTHVTYRSVALNLVSTIDYVWDFTVSGVEGTPMIYYWTQEQYETLDVLTLDNAISYEECVKSGGNWLGIYEGRPASSMFEELYGCLVVLDDQGNVLTSSGILACSPERYCHIMKDNSNAELVDLTRCILIYGDAARTYFAN